MGCRKLIIRFTVPAVMEAAAAHKLCDDVLTTANWSSPEVLEAKFGGQLDNFRVEDAGRLLDGVVLKHDSETVKVMSDVWEDHGFLWAWYNGAVTRFEYNGFVKTERGDENGQWCLRYIFAPGFERPAGAGNYNDEWVKPGQDACYVVYQWDHQPDATEEVRAAAAAWEAEQTRVAQIAAHARYYRGAVQKQIDNEHTVRQGKLVEVVKGRKVPKGRDYWVSYVGEGDYGPYANLRSKEGKAYSFVSLGNLEVQPDWKYVFLPSSFGFSESPTVLGLLRSYAAGECEWDIVCDAIADQDTGEYSGYEFSTYLRELK